MCTTCSCETGATATQAAGDARVYRVEGMTCGHCAGSVSAEVGKVSGVTGVTVDLADGTVAVRGSGFDDDAIRAAVTEAGYRFAGV